MASLRATKRKLDDAFNSLDAAVEQSSQQPPAKRSNTSRSLYSTLAKYGIRAKEQPASPFSPELTKKTPHLSAILARVASKRHGSQPPSASTTPGSDYSPSSISSFLSRLSTFKLATYANKPPSIDAVAAAKCGWTNDSKDRLVCTLCSISWVLTGKEGMSRDAANTLVEKHRVSLVEMHKSGCPWRTRQCDASIYRIPLQSPSKMAKDLKSNALLLEPLLQDVETKHPLTTNQLLSLKSTIYSLSESSALSEEEETPIQTSTPETQPSETAILVSLFGWTLVPERPRVPSRASSSMRSVPGTPSMSRASSVAPTPSTPTRAVNPMPSTPTRPSNVRFNSESPRRDTSLLHCELCQRRVGLWAFAPPPPLPLQQSDSDVSMSTPQTSPSKRPPPRRQFDLLQEHRSYCPYVVRSTIVPTLPSATTTAPPATSSRILGHTRSSSTVSLSQWNGQTDAVEGWKAILAVVSRLGMAQRHTHALGRRTTVTAPSPANAFSAVGTEGITNGGANGTTNGIMMEETSESDAMEVDRVDAMVAGVKSRGGKDLLRYVKGLLGS